MVNATQLSSYMYCPRKLFIGSVLEVKEPPKEALVRGTVWHQTYELLNKGEKGIVVAITNPKYDDIFDMYRKAIAKFLRSAIIMNKKTLTEFKIGLSALFNEYWSDFEEEAKIRALNVAEFMKENPELFGEGLWERLTPKIISEHYFKSEKLGLSGIIDMIEVHDVVHGDAPGKLYVPVELKTGKFPSKGMWDSHRIQLGAYLLMLEDEGKRVSEGILRYRGAEDSRILAMNTLLREEVTRIARGAREVLESLTPPDFVDNRKKCEKCSFKDVCYDGLEMKKLLSKRFQKSP